MSTVSELRQIAEDWQRGGTFNGRDVWEIARDAADEIERMRALCDAYQKAYPAMSLAEFDAEYGTGATPQEGAV